MDEKAIESLKEKLLQEKEKLLGEVNKLKKRNDYGTSEEANIYEFEEREEGLGLGKRLKDLLAEIEGSLKKLENNKYGLCEDCGGKIEMGRLKIYPTAQYCATCVAKPKNRVKR